MSVAHIERPADLEWRTSATAEVAEAECIEAAWEHIVPGLVRIEGLAGRQLPAEPGLAVALYLVGA